MPFSLKYVDVKPWHYSHTQTHRLSNAQQVELTGSPEYVCLKMVPSVKNGAPPEVMQLASTTLQNIKIKDTYKGRATLEFFASPVDRFCDIPIKEVLGGFLYSADLTLEDGEVIHNYLTD